MITEDLRGGVELDDAFRKVRAIVPDTEEQGDKECRTA